MSDDVDSGLAAGTQGAPTPQGSNQQAAQPGSVDAARLQQTLEALTRKLDEVDARSKAAQSDKDRGVAQTRKEVQELKRQIAEVDRLRKSGLEDDDAIEEVTFRDEVRALRQDIARLAPVQAQGTGNPPDLAVEKARILREAQIDANSEEGVRLLTAGHKTAEAFEADAYKLRFRQTRTPSPAAAPTAPGGSIAGSQNVDLQALGKAYEAEVKQHRGNIDAISKIQAEYRKKGLGV